MKVICSRVIFSAPFTGECGRPFATNFHRSQTMLEILVVMAAIVIMMAKSRPKRRRMGRYIRGQVDEEMAIGTLAPKDVISTGFDQTVEERTLVSALVATWALKNVTPSATAGPLLVGIAHSDYTAAEIEAWIESVGSWSEGDLVNQEITNRKIRRIGIFENRGGAEEASVLNNGRPIKTKLNWILTTGQNLQTWAYNTGTGAYATTDPSVDVQGFVNLWPR